MIQAPEKCDCCGAAIKDVFYDARTKFGSWANMDEHCFKEVGLGKLGVGFGQKYVKTESGKWVKQ